MQSNQLRKTIAVQVHSNESASADAGTHLRCCHRLADGGAWQPERLHCKCD